jgi:hypothetical protein
MNHVVCVFIGKFMVMYFDDILIYKKNLNKHLDHLRDVLNVLCSEKLYVNLRLCLFLGNWFLENYFPNFFVFVCH